MAKLYSHQHKHFNSGLSFNKAGSFRQKRWRDLCLCSVKHQSYANERSEYYLLQRFSTVVVSTGFQIQQRNLRSILICVVYRPPNCPISCLEEMLVPNMTHALTLNKDFLIAGDLNCYLIPSVLAAFLLAKRRCVQSRAHLLT